jgi:DNA helicase-2/ATP-dependent DNA helicase PcrA
MSQDSTPTAIAAAVPPYLAALNPAQRQAVEAMDGPVLVLAGAGTGKTRVLTTRLAHILATSRAFPGQLLAVTFTNKAAREMRERLERMIGAAVDGLWLGTFHALAARILRRHADRVGLKSNFTILDADDQLRLLKQIVADADLDDRRVPPRVLLSAFSRWKDRGLSPDKVPADEAAMVADGRGRELYERYQQRLLALCELSGAAEDPQRRRFRRSAAAQSGVVPRSRRGAGGLSAPFPIHPGGRVPGYQRRAVSVAAAAGPEASQSLLRWRR